MFSQSLLSLGPIWFLLGITLMVWLVTDLIIPLYTKKRDLKASTDWSNGQITLRSLRYRTPAQFEEYIADLFSRLGYKTTVVGGPNDGGIDVIAKKNGILHYIQCKKYFNAHQVGVREVREFYGALADHLANGKGYFITTSKFSLKAELFAADKPIELIDGYKLISLISN